MKETLSKLANLSEDEKTEEALLRSRIDEQSQLIMILKARTDEAVLKTKRLENIQDDLLIKTDQLLQLQKEHSLLNKRFNELAENHEEIIKFKDEYKFENERLRLENERLSKENETLFSSKVKERDDIIERLREQFLDMCQKRDSSEIKLSDVKEKLSFERSQFASKLNSLEERTKSDLDCLKETSERERQLLCKTLQDTKNDLQSTVRKLEDESRSKADLDVMLSAKMNRLETERQEYLEMAVHRGKLLQEKQIEQSKLEQELINLKKSLLQEQEKFRQQMALVSVNSRVASLSKQLEDTEKDREALAKEFSAYKDHMSNLLQNERKLNTKLRHFTTK